jgi:hypothetical protein
LDAGLPLQDMAGYLEAIGLFTVSIEVEQVITVTWARTDKWSLAVRRKE